MLIIINHIHSLAIGSTFPEEQVDVHGLEFFVGFSHLSLHVLKLVKDSTRLSLSEDTRVLEGLVLGLPFVMSIHITFQSHLVGILGTQVTIRS